MDGKVVAVAGATGGLGPTVVEAFSRAGASLALVDRDQAKLDTLVASLGAPPDRHHHTTADLFEAELAVAQLAAERVLGAGGCGGKERGGGEGGDGCGAHHTSRRCRWTEIALASRPRSAPAAMPAAIHGSGSQASWTMERESRRKVR